MLEQGMNSSDENMLHFAENWQIENERFVILVLDASKSWKNCQDARISTRSIQNVISSTS